MRILTSALLLCLLAVTAQAGITSFTANPSVFLPGQDVTLSYVTAGGDVLSISGGVGTVAGGSGAVTVLPTAQTTYTLTDSTSGTSAQVTVTPFAAPQLVHRWSFNEVSGNTVLDSVAGPAGNGTIVNQTSGGAWTRVNAAGGTTTPDRVRLPGGTSSVAPYIDLPNAIMSGLTKVSFEGWMTINGQQNWARYYDFGNTTSGELSGPGGSYTGSEYILLSAQRGTSQTQHRFAMNDNGVEQSADFDDTTANGTEFHFVTTYDPTGNNGSPQWRYYKNGVLLSTLNTTFRLQDLAYLNNWLGRSQFSGDNNTQGDYNEFRIWNAPLVDSGVQANFAAGPNALPLVAAFNAFPAATVYRGTSVRLSYVLASGTATGTVDQGVGAVSGTRGFVTVNPTQTTTYTLTATDSGAPQTATVTVVVVPSAPVAENSAASIHFQTATAISLIAHDPNTPVGSLTYTIITNPANGTLSGTGATRTYTPDAGYSGPDSFTFKANDGTSDSNLGTVTLTVNPAAAAPTDLTLSEPSLYTNEIAGSFAGRLRAVDANPDDSFTYQLVSGAGSTDNALFTVAGNQLLANHDFSGDLGNTFSIRLRVTDSTGNQFEKVVTLQVAPPPHRHVKINEINYNTARNTIPAEFIELYNPLPDPVDLSGWRFTKGVTYIFPAGTTIAAHGYLVIAENPSLLQALYGIAPLGPWEGGLSSDGDDIVLRDTSNTVVDEVQYGLTSPWPVPPNGDGPTLELLNPELDGNLGGNWRASVAPPTVISYLAAGSSGWHYRKGTSEASTPIGAWRAEGFVEDGTWLTGTAPIGLFKQNSNTAVSSLPEFGVTLATQLTDMASFNGSTYTASYRSVFFRKTFSVAGTVPRALLLRVMHDDAAIVYINGQEMARFGFQPNSPVDPTFTDSNYYERSNDPWSEVVLLNAPALLHAGVNTIAIEGFAKLPAPRSDQDDPTSYNIFDFAIDAELKNVPETLGTPGAQNSVFTANPPPTIRDVKNLPQLTHSWDPITISARISDPQGVGAVQLQYQICAPGAFIPSTLPYTRDQLLANPNVALQANAQFELASNWTKVPMVDDGSVAGDTPGDGVFTARIPAQPNRTLVRYRISATDLGGATVRIPTADDPRKNYALYVYDGVPAYVANGQLYSPDALTSIPVYQWVMRNQDWTSLLAYTAADQFPNTIQLNALVARRYENFEGALVFNDQVVDHVHVRLRGGNSRYNGAGKRHFRFKFPKGDPLYSADEKGNLYPRPWEEMLFNKMFGNKGYYDFGLPYEVGGRLWRQQGVPIPESHWVHFRVVRNAAEAPDATNGDFWGLYQALELPDGKNFLRARNLPIGNFFKMSDWTQNSEMSERYQAEGAPDFGEDFDNIRYNVHQTATDAFLYKYVNMPLWYRYNAVQEAIRHYDIFTEPTGRHRVKNLIWYFEPVPGNWLGRLWFMPYDWDASFGPNFNNGWDVVHNALYNHYDITDSPTWQLPKQSRTADQIEHRNAIRELRDLVWYRDSATGRGPFDDIVDDAAATLAAFWPIDRARWPATGAVADYSAGLPAKVADMKAFAFSGWTDSLGDGSPTVGAGGRATYLDTISDNVDAGLLPNRPTISYAGAAGFPVDGIALQSSAFSDPQGSATFGSMQWRIGEITDPAAPGYDPLADRVYEVTPVWESGEATPFTATVTVPGTVLRVGHTYRARVRHKDNTGRWSHWSTPLQFTAGTSNYLQVLRDNLMVTEVMYHPPAPSAAETTAGYFESDFEFLELRNISPALTLDLSNVRFTKGVDFGFAGSAITSLPPGARVLVVKNINAFVMRYGAGKPVAGAWDVADSLSNSGEEIKLSYGAGLAIQDFTYDDAAPWPAAADKGGCSLVLRAPETRPDHTKAANWRASYIAGGNPGTDDRATFAEWAAVNSVTDTQADDDRDGIPNLAEYVLRGAPLAANRSILPQVTIESHVVSGVTADYLTLTFTRALGSDAATRVVEWSSDLNSWTPDGVQAASVDHGDGTITEVWRASQPVNANRNFVRLRITQP